MVIDGLQFARTHSELAGRVVGAQLTRLASMDCQTSGIEFRLSGGSNERGKPVLRLSLGGELQLVCQRCLKPLMFQLAVDNELELAVNPAEIAAADDDVDRVVATQSMNVASLVEDEAILSLPMIPRHEKCEMMPKGMEETMKQPSAFHALAALKQRPRR